MIKVDWVVDDYGPCAVVTKNGNILAKISQGDLPEIVSHLVKSSSEPVRATTMDLLLPNWRRI